MQRVYLMTIGFFEQITFKYSFAQSWLRVGFSAGVGLNS